MSDFVTADVLAERYHVGVQTVHAWHRRGWIPCLRAGQRPVLFELAEVDKALKQRGADRTGVALVDPDTNGGSAPVEENALGSNAQPVQADSPESELQGEPAQ